MDKKEKGIPGRESISRVKTARLTREPQTAQYV